MIAIESITFNHDAGAATGDALTIRGNATTSATLPEWRRGYSVTAEDCRVAYAIAPTRGSTLKIEVVLRRLDPSVTSIRVRTFNPNAAAGCLYAILAWLGARFVFAPSSALNLLGEVAESRIDFSGDLSAPHLLDLVGPQLWSRGVGTHYDTWEWQYQTADGDWTSFETTRHKVYSVLDMPTAPWVQSNDLGEALLPWTDVLDYACAWAAGATSADAAAGLIARRIYELGPSLVEYDCPGGGSTHYAGGHVVGFDCSAFVDRLRGGPGRGLYVNCTDCATFLSTFANAIGCDLWQSRMGYGFDLNPILAIGGSAWETACGWGGFSYHEVAWKGDCAEEDPVFDACLRVDSDSDPTAAPHSPLLPANMRFGYEGDGDYRDRLAAPTGRATCNPQPSERKRRPPY